MMNRYLYFAFGSNMNRARMMKRCPDARIIGPAMLPGWRIVARLYADIEPAWHGTVNGVLYGLTAGDFARLDGYEGAPRVYSRRLVTVWYDGADFRAYTYIMTPIMARMRTGIPFPPEYKEICRAGAAENHIYAPEFGR